jgi:hypothetical protein
MYLTYYVFHHFFSGLVCLKSFYLKPRVNVGRLALNSIGDKKLEIKNGKRLHRSPLTGPSL